MRKYVVMVILGTLGLLLLACGTAATPDPTATTAPPTAVPTTAPTVASTVAPTEAMEESEEPEAMEGDYSPELLAIAAELANGPGAIYVGDLSIACGTGSYARRG